MRLLIMLVLVVLTVGCIKRLDPVPPIPGPVVDSHWTEYIIPKGEHFSQTASIQFADKNKLEFKAVFDSSCRYISLKKDNQLDLNKLYGFSDCGTEHHENSARFAWRWNGSNIEIHAYCYLNGKRVSEYLGVLNVNTEGRFILTASTTEYRFTFQEKTHVFTRGCGSDSVSGYRLYPYFGGDETAPHEMKIWIEEL